MLVRTAAPQDLPAIQAIYAHHVLHGLASFEEEAPPLEEMRRRFEDITGSRACPTWSPRRRARSWATATARCTGTRSAYRHTLEDSIYVKQGRQGKGVGKAVLAELIARCTALNYRQIIAVIGDSANAASIRLHASLGFVRAGTAALDRLQVRPLGGQRLHAAARSDAGRRH